MQKYCLTGYDIYFLHGWICAGLSTVGQIDDEEILPLSFILNETMLPNDDKHPDAPAFQKFLSGLAAMLEQLANAVFEDNKLIKPMVNIETPNVFEVTTGVNPEISALTDAELANLYRWLYGYLSGYLSFGVDIQDYCDNDDLLEKVYFPALFTLCVAFLLLDKQLNNNNCNNYFSTEPDIKEFYDTFRDEIENMWESDVVNELDQHEDMKLSESIKHFTLEMVLPKILESLNAIFSVVIYTEGSQSTKH